MTEVSKSSLDTGGSGMRVQDPVSAIFDLIKQISTKANGGLEEEVNISDIKARVIANSYTLEDLDNCIESYANQNIWMLTGADQSKLKWIRINEDEDQYE